MDLSGIPGINAVHQALGGGEADKLTPRQAAGGVDEFRRTLTREEAEIIQSIAQDGALDPKNREMTGQLGRMYQGRSPQLQRIIADPAFQAADQTGKIVMLLGNSSTSGGKMAQIMASDERIPPDVRQALAKMRRQGVPSRTLEEAQAMTDRIYGQGRYRLRKMLGVGTVGEVYTAASAGNSQGKDVVIKLLKDGVSHESLEQERKLARQAIMQAYTEPLDRHYYLNRMERMFDKWKTELDFTMEHRGAVRLTQQAGAKKYRVVKTLEVGRLPESRTAQSLVMEKVEGYTLDELLDMLAVYRKDPAEYARLYAGEIKQHPWLAHPKKWMGQLPQTYLGSFAPQIVNAGQTVITHGDPHLGNIMVNFDAGKKKLVSTWIDTGLTIERSSREAVRHGGVFLNFLVENSTGMAQKLVGMADELPEGIDRKKLVREIAAEFDRQVFKPGLSPAEMGKAASQLLNEVFDKHRLIMNETQVGFLKAQLQFGTSYMEMCSRLGIGSRSVLLESIPEVIKGLSAASFRSPQEVARLLFENTMHGLASPQRVIGGMRRLVLRA